MNKSKRYVALITIFFVLASIINVEFVFAESIQEAYQPIEYIKNDFSSSTELADFELSDNTAWTVADGKLVYETDDADEHTFAKTVNIPAGQSFAMEFKAENLQGLSDLNIYLNGTKYAYSRVDDGTQSNDGEWLILVDRVNGIKFFKDGSEVTATSSGDGQPYITRMKDYAVISVTDIKIGFKGSEDGELTGFDYFYVYSYGDTESYILNFDDASELNNFESTSGTNTVSDGKWNVTGVKEIWPKRVGFTADTTQDLIVDMQLTHPETYKVVSIKPNWKGDTGNYGNIQYPSGIHTAVYNRSDDIVKIYQNGTQRATSTLGLTTTPIDFVGFGVKMDSTSTKISFDYFNVYVQGMRAEVTDAATDGLTLHTNMPLDLENSSFSVAENACSVQKSNEGYMTYDVSFAEELAFGEEYSLVTSLKTLTGRTYTDSIIFEASISQAVIDALGRLNSSSMNPTQGEENFADVVAEVAEYFNITEYKDNIDIIEIAEDLRDDEDGFGDIDDVRRIFEEAEVILGERMIQAAVNRLNTAKLNPEDGEEEFSDVVNEVAEILGITLYKNNAQVIEEAVKLRDDKDGFVDADDVRKVFQQAEFAVLRKEGVFAKNDFNSAFETQQFTFTDATNWTVSGGKLVSLVSDSSLQNFEKNVGIPLGQSFVIELAAEDLYSESDLIISLNDTESVKISTSGAGQALDGKWTIYYDRIRGVKVYKDGSEITTESSPALTGSEVMFDAISKVGISFKGNSEGAKFDYVKMYGFGSGDVTSYESDYSDYSGSDYIIDRDGARFDLVIADGKVQPRDREQYALTKDISVDDNDNIVIEFKVSNTETYKKFRVMLNANTLYEHNPQNAQQTGEYRIIINRSSSSYEVYKNGSRIDSKEGITLPEEISTAGVFVFGTSSKFDYFNVYTVDSTMTMQSSNVTTQGLTLITNVPIASVKAGDVASTLERVDNKYFEYNVSFDAELEEGVMYTLEAEDYYGNIISSEILMPVSQAVMDGLNRLNMSKLNPDQGEESFAAVVNELAEVFGIASYKDNAEIIEMAASLRDEQGGFTDKSNVKTIFIQSDEILSKKNGDIETFINYVNGVSAFDSGVMDAYTSGISLAAKTLVDDAMEVSEFRNIWDIKSKLANYIVVYGISHADNSEQVYDIIESLGKSTLSLTDGELSKNNLGVCEKLMEQISASIRDIVDKYRRFIKEIFEEKTESFCYMGSGFDSGYDINTFILSNTAGWSVKDGKLLCDTNKNNATVHTIEKDVNISETDNFVFELSSEHIYRWSDLCLYLNDAEAVKIKTVNSSIDGVLKIVFDRSNGVKIYLNGSELATETNPKVEKNSMTGIAAVNKVKLSFRGSDDKNDGVCLIDYMKMYQITSGAKIENADSESLEIVFPPIITDGVDLKDYILVDETPVARVENISGARYKVFFSSSITFGENHTLSITEIPCEYGITITGDYEFRTRDKIKDISMQLLNPPVEGSSQNPKSKIRIEITNEYDSGENAVIVIATYSSKGEMLGMRTADVSYSDGVEFVEIEMDTEEDVILELYAVDGLNTYNRVSKKTVYNISDGNTFATSMDLTDNEALKVSHNKDLEKNTIVFSLAAEEEKKSEVTLAVSLGYDEDAPTFSMDNLLYIKNEVLLTAEASVEICVPDDNKNYDLYAISEDTGAVKIGTVSMYKASEILSAFDRIKAAEVNPDPGEENIKDVVSDVADIFDITEYINNEAVIKIAGNLRDEQGGFADKNDVAALFELADFIDKKSDGNIENFINQINEKSAFNQDALYIFQEKKISETAISNIKQAVNSAKFTNLSDIKTKFAEYVALYGVNNASHYSQVSNVINKLGTSVIGLTTEEVSKLTDDVAIAMLNKGYDSIESMKNEFKTLISPSSQNPGGGAGGGAGGGGNKPSGSVGGPGSYASNSQSSSGNSQPTSTTAFSDIGNVEWAKNAILSLAEKGIISGRGDGKFAPNDNCTRAEIARMICSALNLSLVASSNCTDVSIEDWSYPYVSAISSAGIMTGTDSNVFSPNMSVTREMMAVIICRAAQHINKAFPEANATFGDISLASEYAVASIGALQNAGIISGVDGVNYAPKKMCTRAEIAKIIDGFLKYVQ